MIVPTRNRGADDFDGVATGLGERGWVLEEILSSGGQTTRPIRLLVTSCDAVDSSLDEASDGVEKRESVTRDEGKGKRHCQTPYFCRPCNYDCE